MTDDIGSAALNLVAASYSTGDPRKVSGILIDRDRPLGSGYCGNDDCDHRTHKDMRRAQKAADTKRNTKVVA